MDGPFVLTLFCARYIMECNLWEFGPRWDVTLDSEGWLEAIRKFWEKNQSVENRDFMAGYCTHFLTDWENTFEL